MMTNHLKFPYNKITNKVFTDNSNPGTIKLEMKKKKKLLDPSRLQGSKFRSEKIFFFMLEHESFA